MFVDLDGKKARKKVKSHRRAVMVVRERGACHNFLSNFHSDVSCGRLVSLSRTNAPSAHLCESIFCEQKEKACPNHCFFTGPFGSRQSDRVSSALVLSNSNPDILPELSTSFLLEMISLCDLNCLSHGPLHSSQSRRAQNFTPPNNSRSTASDFVILQLG